MHEAASLVMAFARGSVFQTGVAFVALLELGCERKASSEAPVPQAAGVRDTWELPATDRGAPCRDVGDATVCERKGRLRVTPRSLPRVAAPSELGFRCWEASGKRYCADRLKGAGPFVCTTQEPDNVVCVQRAPRLPQGGIWDCGDDAGAVVCLGQDGAPEIDAAWTCSSRRGAETGQRVCVDHSPDYPDGRAEGWNCRFDDDPRAVGGRARSCVRTPKAAMLGAACDPKSQCLRGANCVSGYCVPSALRPGCIADQDCPSNACRFGSCTSDSHNEPQKSGGSP